jgi:hypothetical protein
MLLYFESIYSNHTNVNFISRKDAKEQRFSWRLSASLRENSFFHRSSQQQPEMN